MNTARDAIFTTKDFQKGAWGGQFATGGMNPDTVGALSLYLGYAYPIENILPTRIVPVLDIFRRDFIVVVQCAAATAALATLESGHACFNMQAPLVASCCSAGYDACLKDPGADIGQFVDGQCCAGHDVAHVAYQIRALQPAHATMDAGVDPGAASVGVAFEMKMVVCDDGKDLAEKHQLRRILLKIFADRLHSLGSG